MHTGFFLVREEEEVRTCEGKQHGDSKVRAEGGGGSAPGARAEIPLQAVVRTMVQQLCPCSPWGSTGDAEIHRQPMGEVPLPEWVDVWRRL